MTPRVAAWDLLTCWVHCMHGRDELVAITAADRDELMKGAMLCPGCSTTCAPNVEISVVSADISVSVWRAGRWQRGFVLKD